MMKFKFPGLRTLITLTVVALGLISLSLAIFTGEIYQKLTLNNQINSISKIIEHDTKSSLAELNEKLMYLSLNLQKEENFRNIYNKRDKEKLLNKINRHFYQYLVTADIIDLEKIYIYDINYKLIAESTEKPENDFNKIICSELINRAKKRVDTDRLRIISYLCNMNKRSFYSILVPIGGLKPQGYLQIVANPIHNLKNIEQRLGSPIKVSSDKNTEIFKTKNWPAKEQMENALLAGYDLYSDNNEYLFTITTAHDISELNKKLNKTRNFLIFIALTITLLSVLLSFIILRKSTTLPVNNLLTQLRNIRKNKDNLGKEIQIIGAQELKEVAIEFNHMTKELQKLYKKTSQNNALLKNEVTERKIAEEALQVAHEILEQRIEERTADLKEVSEQAQKSNMAKSEFLSRMSHELRTPLNAILGYAELMLADTEDKLSESHRYEVEVTLKAGMHLLNLINEILDLSTIETGKIDISNDEVSLDKALKEACTHITPVAKNNNIAVNCQYNSIKNIYIRTEYQRLKQILLNLLSNAVKYNEKEGSVTINIEYPSETKLKISIIDNGIGIKSEELDKIFTPFNRLEEYKNKVNGTGIGLTITKSLVELMGGEIGVNSKPKEGSTFWVTLPYYTKEGIPSGLSAKQDSISTNANVNSKNNSSDSKKILIVEDDEVNQELMLAMVNTFSIKADIAENGLIAIEKIKSHDDYALIFMDLTMPEMGGLEATKIIRNLDSEKRKSIIIALTANAMPGDKEKCLEAGMDDYTEKPVSLKRLKEVLDKWL